MAEAERNLGPIESWSTTPESFPRAAFLELDEAQWDPVLDTNLKGTFVCSQEAARRMVEAGRAGVIINLASGAPFGAGCVPPPIWRASWSSWGSPAEWRASWLPTASGSTRRPRRHQYRYAAAREDRGSLRRAGQPQSAGQLAEPEDIAGVIFPRRRRRPSYHRAALPCQRW